MDNRRVEAEVIRDSILAVGGNLDLALGGPDIAPDQARQVPRRSLYFGSYPEDGGRINMLGCSMRPIPTAVIAETAR